MLTMTNSMYNPIIWPGADGSEWTDLPEALPHAFDLFLDALNGENVPLISVKEAADRSSRYGSVLPSCERQIRGFKPQKISIRSA